jgi:hypothetical protein
VRQRAGIVTVGIAGLAGFVLLAVPGGGVQEVVGSALLALMLIVVVGVIVGRLGPQSQPDRAREAAAREEFDRTGEWPADR